MKKTFWAFLVCFVLAAVLTLSVCASERMIKMDKTTFNEDEDIIVMASGEEKDWVGIYAMDEVPGGGPASIYWYYVETDAEPGAPVVLQEQRGNNRDLSDLPAGEYQVHLLLDDAYEIYDTINITIVATLDTDKFSYTEGDDILVTAHGEGKDWVGIYAEGDVPGGGDSSIYWYYVADEGHESDTQVSLKSSTFNSDREALKDLPAGKYVVYLFSNDGYDIIDSRNVTIKEAKKTEEAPAPAAEAAPEEPVAEPESEKPAEEKTAEDAPVAISKGSSTGIIIGIAAAVIVIGAVVGVILAKKKK